MEQEQKPNGNDSASMMGAQDRKPEARDLSRPAFPRAAERAGITTSAMVRDAARLRTVMTRAAEDAAIPEADQAGNGAGMETRGEHREMHAPAGGEHPVDRVMELPLPDMKEWPENSSGYDHPGDGNSANGSSDGGNPEDLYTWNVRPEHGVPAVASQPEPDHAALENAGYGATKIVMPKSRTASSTYRSEPSHPIPDATVATGSATRLRPVAALRPVATGNVAEIPGPAASDPRLSQAVASVQSLSHVDVPGQQGAASPAYNDLWDAAATAATPKVASESWQQVRQEKYERRGGGFKRGALAVVMVLAGTTIGIGLYISGSGFLSEFFSNKNEGVATLSPSAVTELPPALAPEEPLAEGPASIPDPALANDIGNAGTSATPSTPVEGRIAPSSEAPKKPDAAAVSSTGAGDAGKKPAPAKPEGKEKGAAQADAGKSAGREDAAKSPEKPKAPAKGEEKGGSGKKDDTKTAAEERGAAAGKYIVQVRATSDESEANLIVKKLRKKGISNAQVVRSEKNGVPFYKVRFVAAGTSNQAQEKAKSAGYADAWVVRQK